MRVGIITTWFERGAAYVSKGYMENLVKEGHIVYIYARGEGSVKDNDLKWNQPYVTWGKKAGSDINRKDFFQWIKEKKLEVLFFNEQRHFKIVAVTKKAFPNIKIGSYIDYYTEKTIAWYNIYDFLICNTYRHMEAMENHPQKFYLRWGTDLSLYKPINVKHDKVVFFHSVGMSDRKGTDILLDAYIHSELYKSSKLVIHTQIPIERVCNYKKKELEAFGIQIIEKTVTAPGLYYLGDVYVYPTRLDGLGLTMYEALASGIPVITTDYPPMNEIIDNEVGRLVSLKRNYARQDGYYWPMSVCKEESLVESMRYYIDCPEKLKIAKRKAREKAEKYYNWEEQSKPLAEIFENAKILALDKKLYEEIMVNYKKMFIRDKLLDMSVWIYNKLH